MHTSLQSGCLDPSSPAPETLPPTWGHLRDPRAGLLLLPHEPRPLVHGGAFSWQRYPSQVHSHIFRARYSSTSLSPPEKTLIRHLRAAGGPIFSQYPDHRQAIYHGLCGSRACFFSTAALLLLFRWLETKQPRDLLLAGICCGLGIGTKYNGLLVLFILTFILPILFIRTQEQKQGTAPAAVKAAVLFCLAALLTASPCLIRNAVWTGNPLYPLYNGFFNPTASPAPTEHQVKENEENNAEQVSSGARGVFATRYVLYQENIWQLLLLPVRIFFEGQDNDPRYFDGRLNPFLFFLPLLSFLGIRQEKKQPRLEKATLAAFSLFYFLFAFNTGVLRIRYLVPIVPFLVILSIYGLNNLKKLSEKYAKKSGLVQLVWPLTVCLLLLWNASYIGKQFKDVDPFSYITGRLTRDEYLNRKIPEYPVMQYANKNLSDSAKILCLFLGSRGYYLDKKHIFDSYGNHDLLLSWLQQPESDIETLQENLQHQGITHLIIRADLMVQWLKSAEPGQQKLWNQFNSNHLIAVYSHLNYILYQVRFR